MEEVKIEELHLFCTQIGNLKKSNKQVVKLR